MHLAVESVISTEDQCRSPTIARALTFSRCKTFHRAYKSLILITCHSRNYKRVAEVWMDDYKRFIYSRDPERYERVDAGDLSFQRSIKTKLNCKPFKHFIENVAPDLLEFYPLIDPPPFAKGAVSE